MRRILAMFFSTSVAMSLMFDAVERQAGNSALPRYSENPAGPSGEKPETGQAALSGSIEAFEL
jgi:hypothetical protein